MANRMLIAVVLGQTLSTSVSGSSVAYSWVKTCGTAAHVVTVNLADAETRVSVALAHGGKGEGESFKSIVNRARPKAAITGTFFDTRTLIPTGDIAVFGSVVHTGCIGAALCIDPNNRASIVSMPTGRKSNWAGYETVLCGGPMLVMRGKPSVSLERDGFGRSLRMPATRTAVGITRAGKLLLVAINRKTSLSKMANVMASLGAVDALSLDGGSSTGFYADGRYFANPPRRLTNVLVVYSKSADYERAATALVPSAWRPKVAIKPLELVGSALTAAAAMPSADGAVSGKGALH